MVRALLLVVALALVGCADDAPPPPDPKAAPTPTFIDPQLKQMDKARAVEGVLKDDAKRTDEALEDQGG